MHPFEINGRKYSIDRVKMNPPKLDLIQWLQHRPIYPKVFWKDREKQVFRAAVGNLLCSSTPPYFSGTPPFDLRFYGGIRFGDKSPGDETWQNFPKTCFWLPQIELSQNEGQTEAVFYFFHENPSIDTEQFNSVSFPSLPFGPYSVIDQKETPSFTVWKKNVNTALEAISSGDLEKIVFARKTSLHFSHPIEIWNCFNKLIDKSKHATLFAFQPSPSLCFLGATPEKLFERTGRVLNASVLAATRPRGKTPEEDLKFEQELLSNAKEQREFNIVKKFLEETISPLADEMSWNNHDQILKASHVQHIHNRLNAILKENIRDDLLINVLHPTPALGGSPQGKALSFLKSIEPFDRGWYGAPIGMIGTKETSLYVAIRSALIQKNMLHLFAGTGLVQGSIAEQEWSELEQKIQPFVELFSE